MLLVTKIWEQRELGNIVVFIRNGITIKQDGNFGKPITRIESISEGKLNLNKVGYANITSNVYEDYYLKNNDILFSNINSLNHIGKTSFVHDLSQDVIHGMNLLNIRVDKNHFNSRFVYYQLAIMKSKNLFKKIAKPAINQASIAVSELKKLSIKTTSIKEQYKIQKLLATLENILTLYERKVKLLLQIKKYLLNNLFSEKEYPDLRFKYSKKDNWKKISLSSVLTYKNGKAHEKEINNKGNLDLVMMNSITTEGRLITKKKIFSPQDTLSKNDIVIVLSDIAKGELIGKSSVIPCDDQYVLNQRIGCLRPTSNIDSFFVSKYINQKSQYFKSHAAGTSQINLSKSDVLNCTIYIPNIDEQHYVSNFIINIEKNINFYKDKKQCFIEIKNTLLNNMFI